MDFAASLGITLALWTAIGALAYGAVRLLFYIKQFKKMLWFTGLLFAWYVFAPHVGIWPDLGACPAEPSRACDDLAFATIFFLFPAAIMAMVQGHERFGWFGGRVASYDQDGPDNEDDLGIMRRFIPAEVLEKKEKHVSIFTAGRRTPKKLKICPICKRATRCRIGVNPFAGVSFHTIRE